MPEDPNKPQSQVITTTLSQEQADRLAKAHQLKKEAELELLEAYRETYYAEQRILDPDITDAELERRFQREKAMAAAAEFEQNIGTAKALRLQRKHRKLSLSIRGSFAKEIEVVMQDSPFLAMKELLAKLERLRKEGKSGGFTGITITTGADAGYRQFVSYFNGIRRRVDQTMAKYDNKLLTKEAALEQIDIYVKEMFRVRKEQLRLEKLAADGYDISKEEQPSFFILPEVNADNLAYLAEARQLMNQIGLAAGVHETIPALANEVRRSLKDKYGDVSEAHAYIMVVTGGGKVGIMEAWNQEGTFDIIMPVTDRNYRTACFVLDDKLGMKFVPTIGAAMWEKNDMAVEGKLAKARNWGGWMAALASDNPLVHGDVEFHLQIRGDHITSMVHTQLEARMLETLLNLISLTISSHIDLRSVAFPVYYSFPGSTDLERATGIRSDDPKNESYFKVIATLLLALEHPMYVRMFWESYIMTLEQMGKLDIKTALAIFDQVQHHIRVSGTDKEYLEKYQEGVKSGRIDPLGPVALADMDIKLEADLDREEEKHLSEIRAGREVRVSSEDAEKRLSEEEDAVKEVREPTWDEQAEQAFLEEVEDRTRRFGGKTMDSTVGSIIESIASPAIRTPDGKICLNRNHAAIIHDLVQLHGYKPPIDRPGFQQGFITAGGRFVDRQEAASIAFHAGQTTDGQGPLFSEELPEGTFRRGLIIPSQAAPADAGRPEKPGV